ncbi:cytochrome P450 [Streptomyces cinerochromogenes]|uniref:cytochrome P450 n=1 Tax=Streptomyces cinerochromogenes TaxID=66422 RepID=UPI001670D28F|nr:cytochrome P450 [Streptomyces cinerochromogenes]GGS68388.1 cytochrome P450 hydroxylase [Streptomyces cinerochromogenes]
MSDDTLPQYPLPLGPLGEPPEEYSELRAKCPVTKVRLPSGDTAWMVTGYDEVSAAMSDRRLSRAALREPGAVRTVSGEDFSDNPYNLLNQEGPDHSRLRRLISPAFTPRKAELWRPRIEQIANELIDRLAEGPRPADLHHDFAAVLPVWVICEMVGAPVEDREKLQRWTDRLVSITAHTPEERLAAREESAAYVAGLVARHREEPGEDLLSTLITARDDDDRLNERELVWLGINLLVAGHDTTVSAISRGLFQLLRHQDQWRLLADNPDLLPQATEELLRYAPPSEIGFMRIATEDVELAGTRVAKGEGVIPVMHAAGRDVRRVSDPERLDLTRTDIAHLAFGHGHHYCPGAGVARVELQAAFGTLARRLPSLHLAVPAEQVEWVGGLLTLRPRALPVEW